MAHARITQQWSDETVTVCEVGSDEAAHPDLLDEMVRRVCVLWSVTCKDGDDEGDE